MAGNINYSTKTRQAGCTDEQSYAFSYVYAITIFMMIVVKYVYSTGHKFGLRPLKKLRQFMFFMDLESIL